MLLQRRDQIRDELDRHDHLDAHRRADDVLGLRVTDFLVRERHHFTEGQREVERRVSNRTEVRVGSRRRRLDGVFCRNDGEVDLLGLIGHAQY